MKQDRDPADSNVHLHMHYFQRQPAIVLALFVTFTTTGLLQAQSALAQVNRVEALEQMDTSEPMPLAAPPTNPSEPTNSLNQIEQFDAPIDQPNRSIDQIHQIHPIYQMLDSVAPPQPSELEEQQDDSVQEPVQDGLTQENPAQENSAQEDLVQDEILPQQRITAWNQNRYDRAKTELTEEFYTLYRMVDRLSRANQLDAYSWQVNLVNDAAQPTSAQRANRIMMDRALFDQLHGDVHALACIVGREMAHTIQRHTFITAAERDRVFAQLQADAEAEVAQEFGTEEQPDRRSSLGGTVLRGVGRLFGGIGTVVTGVADTIIDNQRSEQAAELAAERQQQIEERYQAKVAEMEQQWAELSDQQTLEADRLGYEYMVSASFDPQGCIRAVQAMPLTAGVSTSTETADRLEALQTLAPQHEQWETQGRSNLEISAQALGYESFGQNQLRVHARIQQQGIDQILGE